MRRTSRRGPDNRTSLGRQIGVRLSEDEWGSLTTLAAARGVYPTTMGALLIAEGLSRAVGEIEERRR